MLMPKDLELFVNKLAYHEKLCQQGIEVEKNMAEMEKTMLLLKPEELLEVISELEKRF
jgi:hypothetical protein